MTEMTENSRLILVERFERYVDRYRGPGGLLPAALELKYAHSRRVAENARTIAEGLDHTPSEVLLAEACGLAHDIGRFPQYERYGSSATPTRWITAKRDVERWRPKGCRE